MMDVFFLVLVVTNMILSVMLYVEHTNYIYEVKVKRERERNTHIYTYTKLMVMRVIYI